MTTPQADRPPLVTTLIQSFFIIPFWEARNLAKMVRSGNLNLRRRLVVFSGALLLAVAGWWALGILFPGACCQQSTVLFPNEPVARLIWPRLMPTIGMLALIAIGGVVFTALLLGLSALSRRLASFGFAGKLLDSLRWLATSILATPLGHIAVLATLLLGIRFNLLPVPVGRSAAGLIVPGLSVALLPALIAARYVERALPDPLSHPGHTIKLAAASFYRQASWLVGGLAVAETAFGVDGLGKLLVGALRVRDKSLILTLLLLFMVATALCRLHVIHLETDGSISATKQLPPSSSAHDFHHWFKWIAFTLVLAAPLAFAYSGRAALLPDSTTVYATPSALHPWGTDGAGRDILMLARLAIRQGWLLALAGGLVSIGLGGLWAIVIAWLRNKQHQALADGLRAISEAVVLLAPAPLMVWLLMYIYEAPPQPAIALGATVGIVITPRMVWGINSDKLVTLRPVDWKRQLGYQLAAGFAVLQFSLMAMLMIGQSTSNWATPGGLLAAYQDIIGGANLLEGGPYLRLTLGLALPGVVLAWGWYLLADALAEPVHAEEMADLLG